MGLFFNKTPIVFLFFCKSLTALTQSIFYVKLGQ